MSSMNQKYYSQHGEDFLLEKIFKNKDNGFFVEVGCVDGRRFSNTLFFEERGWQGLCIEAHNDYIEILRKNRTGSNVIHAAVGATNKSEVSFYADKRGSLSSLDQSKEEELKRDYPSFTGFKKQIVPLKTLDRIFDENSVQEIDILSLDIEGGEINALKGLNFSKYEPTVLIIEFDSIGHLYKLKKMLSARGYYSGPILGTNIFFSKFMRDVDLIGGKIFEGVVLTHTGNQYQDEADVKINTDINTRFINQLKRLLIMAVIPIVHWVRRLIGRYD